MTGRTARKKPDQDTRGDQTARRLLQVGLQTFSRYGLDGVTTRKLAQAARVNVAAIAYYFGGKDGYYMAVMRYIVQERNEPLWDILTNVRGRIPSEPANPQAARTLLCELLASLTRMMLLHPDGICISGIIAREQLRSTPAFDILYQGMLRPVHETIATLVGLATGRPSGAQDTILAAHGLLGQVLAFRLCQTTLLRRLQWDRVTQKRAGLAAASVARLAGSAVGDGPPPPGVPQPAARRRNPGPSRRHTP
jgi:AcrR family transcriptional regulator